MYPFPNAWFGGIETEKVKAMKVSQSYDASGTVQNKVQKW